MADLKTFSKGGFSVNDGSTAENIKLSCLMRIADATELMANNYTRLQNELQWMKECKERQRVEANKLFNQVRTLKGVITKLKKKADKPVIDAQ